ncbi:MAG: dehydratase [Chloroflexi bacterium]|nr:dehydratase [Chloroflexota bacterium]MBU1749014.1 dehydratase [Chloroflexota bacterium]
MADIATRGRYFEELGVGAGLVTPARTITETDLVMFSGLTSDYNQLHTDVEFAAAAPFGARIAHGLLVLSYAMGLLARTGVFEGTAIAFMGLECKFKKPVYIGDTIRLRVGITRKRPLSQEAGMVFVQADVLNQKDEVTQTGEWRAIVARKPQEE